jgi:formylglycine-generating enzyme required for sulfatase activity
MNTICKFSALVACGAGTVLQAQSQLTILSSRELRLKGTAQASIYRVEGTTNLAPRVVWQSITNVTLGRADWTFHDVEGEGMNWRFYRAVLLSLKEATNATANPDPSRWAWIPSGTFVMGSPTNEPARWEDESQHTVTVTRGFYMSKYETRQREYLAVMSNNPSYFSTDHGYAEDLDRPLEWVAWIEATNYCGRLTALEQAAGRLPKGWIYRLPTEAEWEYACRAGATTPFHYGPMLASGMANFDGEYEYPPLAGETNYHRNTNGICLGQTSAVGGYWPNRWGLYDMHGDVLEWCWDRYDTYPTNSVSDPHGPDSGLFRVLRGGSWHSSAPDCRAALRDLNWPDTPSKEIGFRAVLAPFQP